MKVILFIAFLIQNDFPNTRSRQSSFLLTNQNAHLIRHEPMKVRVTKVKLKFKSSAGKRASCKWKWYELWILLNLWEKCLKFGEKRGNIQKIYDSVRKELQDECHCAWSPLKVTWTCLIWQSEKIVEKLNRTSCLVKFCWFGFIAQAGRVEFTAAAKSEGINSIILLSCLVHSSKFKWSFFEHLTAKTRQPIACVKFDFKTFAVCSIEFTFKFIVHSLKKTECDFENFVVVIKCKNYLENVYCVFCCIFCCLRLSPFDEVVQITNKHCCSSFFCFLSSGSKGKRWSIPKWKLGKVFFIWIP